MVEKVYIHSPLVEGKFLPIDEQALPLKIFLDHGFLYGDGVFEGIRIYNGGIFKLPEHLDRLWNSAEALKIKIPIEKDELTKHLRTLCRQNQIKDSGYIRLVVTRGVGDLGINPKKCTGEPTIFAIARKIQLYPSKAYEQGLRTIITKTIRTPNRSRPAWVKSLNYLNSILAVMEVNEAGVDEGIMLNAERIVTECTADNIFWVKNKVIYTPSKNLEILIGITRNTIIKLGRELGYEVWDDAYGTPDKLFKADEVFLTGTAAEVAPVVKINGRKVGDGRPGRITLELLAAFREETKKPENLTFI